jgi:amino acid transporter
VVGIRLRNLRRRGALRRQIGFLGTISLSVGVMAPTLAMSLTGVQASGLVGRAAPLAFVFASVGVAFVAYGFVRLSSHFSHAGSVYAFTGMTLGPRAGFFSGWALLGTYIVFPPVSIMGIAIFGQAFLRTTGIASSPPWWPLALAGWAVIAVLASRGALTTVRSLLTVELVAVVLILALVVVILVELATGAAPRGLGYTSAFLHFPAGVDLSTIVFAASAGFLSFAGFEAAGSFGEEALDPRRTIPRALVVAIAFGSVFYVLCMTAQTLGFGTDPAGVRAFSHSAAPLGDLAKSYVGSPLAAVLDLVAVLSAVGAGLGCASVGTRMLFALGRDGILSRDLAGVAASTGTPAAALGAELMLSLCAVVGFAIAGTPPLDVFFYLATIGILSLLVMYVVTNLGALRYLFLGGERRVPLWEIVFPLGGIGFAVYTLYKNLWPVPDYPFNVFPYVVAGWLAVGLGVATLVPGFVERVGPELHARTEVEDGEPSPTGAILQL